jgi:hypothetical protein
VERLEKVQEIGKELINQEFMSESIETEIQNVLDRWEKLQHQVYIFLTNICHGCLVWLNKFKLWSPKLF